MLSIYPTCFIFWSFFLAQRHVRFQLPYQGSNLPFLCWKAKSQLLDHQGSPLLPFKYQCTQRLRIGNSSHLSSYSCTILTGSNTIFTHMIPRCISLRHLSLTLTLEIQLSMDISLWMSNKYLAINMLKAKCFGFFLPPQICSFCTFLHSIRCLG